VRIGIVALLANLVLGSASAWYLTSRGFAGPHVGLAGATSLAALLNAALLYRGLRLAGVLTHAPGWGFLLGRVALANLAMVAALWALHRDVAWWLSAGLTERVVWLGVAVAAGAGAYFIALFVLGMRPAQFRLRHD
jgi:putative peptidoglycan lipid II flippase